MASAEAYWTLLRDGFRKARKAIEDFNPDFVLIWGDDQYEAIQEDMMTAFTVFNIPEIELKRRIGVFWSPEQSANGGSAIVEKMKGHTEAATHLTNELVRSGFEVAQGFSPAIAISQPKTAAPQSKTRDLASNRQQRPREP